MENSGDTNPSRKEFNDAYKEKKRAYNRKYYVDHHEKRKEYYRQYMATRRKKEKILGKEMHCDINKPVKNYQKRKVANNNGKVRVGRIYLDANKVLENLEIKSIVEIGGENK